ncbi:MAG: hypothetical protein HYT12_00570 [Candidatus Liptonbacteria bacterium]|nr:hypothetical protein [Candidatus Liptonbacteria bacterium]
MSQIVMELADAFGSVQRSRRGSGWYYDRSAMFTLQRQITRTLSKYYSTQGVVSRMEQFLRFVILPKMRPTRFGGRYVDDADFNDFVQWASDYILTLVFESRSFREQNPQPTEPIFEKVFPAEAVFSLSFVVAHIVRRDLEFREVLSLLVHS